MKHYKKMLIISLLAIIFFSIIFIFNDKVLQTNSQKICIGENCFQVEIANTLEKKVLGLSNRDSLDLSSGMLFPYPKGEIPGFWMKDMRFPIDIVWINYEMKISGIVKDFQPCEDTSSCPVIYSEEEIIYVLEINAGLSEKYGFEAGNSVKFVKLK